MSNSLLIVGGTYLEVCDEPESEELFGSGLRAAAALGSKGFEIKLASCIGKEEVETANSICKTFEIVPSYEFIEETVGFYYYHPLTPPEPTFSPEKGKLIQLPLQKEKCILYYGMIEASASVQGEYVVYDAQNRIPFSATQSSANHLALVLNRNEAYMLSESSENYSLEAIGEMLLSSQNAEVVVIKNGSKGALVVDGKGSYPIPLFETTKVWPIGSGDIFSAVFAWKWAIEHVPPYEAAMQASKYTATYCQTKSLPLPESPEDLNPIKNSALPKKIYLAGPFFTMGQRWLINEFRSILLDFGNDVFSPYHDIGLVKTDDFKTEAHLIANKDLMALRKADLILAIVCDHDPGTLFEIGFGIALEKKIIVFSENVSKNDLLCS